ncbi:molybdopterin oxidoreductase family protein [Lacihabitans sp. CCS-44]|uniref:molybdopterin-containing oxidoreductase family protein n=1 Tax=Lacihabitans sp. CCS-44 TaxID=2487331 RepID=UPI0020CE637D|nr:molybdopterin-dependent oxidoreductase [Lacihabitans sp. CCS-44]MCP9754788.1 molybdopterin oxidoreductase family protein [Lacihabitans sp. CCS-44]
MRRRTFIELSTHGIAALGSIPFVSFSCAEKNDTKTVNGACCLDCPDSCSWQVTVSKDKVTEFKANNDNPYTAGKLCNKMEDYPTSVTFNPKRLLNPLKRTGKKGEGKFKEITWDKAISEISTKLKTIIKEKSGEAIMPFSYGGNEGNVQGNAGNNFFAHIGATELERTICGDAIVAGIMATNGQTTGVLPEDIIHSQYILLWGTNTVHSNQHLWPFIQKAKAKGAIVVVIDPFQSQTAFLADWHIQPLPGTDTALALGLIHIILKEKLQDQDYIEKYTNGIEELTKHIEKYPPKIVAEITGLDETTILKLAHEYAKGKPSLIRVLIGLEHQTNGASAARVIAMLPALTGAWRQLGGGLMNMTYELFGNAFNYKILDIPEALKNKKTRKINMVQLGEALTSTNLNPKIQALIVFNSNPAVTMPNQNLVVKGLQREDLLTIVLDHFITDSARYADYVFPATTALENWDILASYGTPYLNINEPAIEPLGQAKTNTEFFRLLSKEMGFNENYLYHSDLDIVKGLLDSDKPYLAGISFESLRKTGWAKMNIPEKWMPHAEGNFGKKDGKCQFYNSEITPALPDYIPFAYSEKERTQFPLHLLTIKSTKNFLNSTRANHEMHIQKEGKPFLDMNEEDAKSRNLVTGDDIKVFNQRGEVYLNVRVKNKVRKGVVCMPQGFWSSLMKGGSSANALTHDILTDMGGSAALQEARVEVMKV